MCLEIGYHPRVFKTAILCAIPKFGKFFCSFPQLYWLVVLLSYLGKALERIVARRSSYMALKYKLLSSFYYGATLYRSAVDAAAILTHNIEKAFFDKKIMSALTFDIKKNI